MQSPGFIVTRFYRRRYMTKKDWDEYTTKFQGIYDDGRNEVCLFPFTITPYPIDRLIKKICVIITHEYAHWMCYAEEVDSELSDVWWFLFDEERLVCRFDREIKKILDDR